MKNTLSLSVLILVLIIDFSASFFYYPKWENKGTEAVISWDASGYYMYLPAIFIYKDIKKCTFQYELLEKYNPTPDFQQAFLHSSGNYVMKYSSGQAIMLSPAFFIAHLYTTLTKAYPADGFSRPYQFSVAIWCLFVSLFGLFVLRNVLLCYFEDNVVAITLFSIALCTNYFDYVNFSGSMSHNTLFTLYAVLLLVTKKYYDKPTIRLAVLIGALCGLATITRPTEFISVLIPIAWGIDSFQALKDRFQFFKKKMLELFTSAIAYICVVSIQLIYWKWVSGEWLVYSYQNQEFDWLHPHIVNCLFSPKAGWLLYSPVFVLSTIGFYFLFKSKPFLFWTCAIFTIPFTYFCFSWSEWWYGWSIGQRAMIQSYPLWAFPMAAFFSSTFKKQILKSLSISMVVFFFLYNAWLIHHSHRGGLFKGPEMTFTYLMKIFGKLSVDDQVFTLLDNEEYIDEPYTTELIYQNDFSNDTSVNACFIDSTNRDKKLLVNKTLEFTSKYYLDKSLKKEDWYKVSAEFTSTNKEWDTWKMSQFIITFYKDKKEIKNNMIRVFRLLHDNETKRIHFFAKAPDSDFDAISIHFYNAGSDKQIYIDNLKVEIVNVLK